MEILTLACWSAIAPGRNQIQQKGRAAANKKISAVIYELYYGLNILD